MPGSDSDPLLCVHTCTCMLTHSTLNTSKKVNASKKVNTATLPYLTFTFMYLLLPYPMLPYTTFTTFTYIPRGGTGVIPP